MIKDLFEENKISYQNTDVPQQLTDLKLDGRILEYLSCMGRDLKFYVSEYGVASTRLFSVETILEEVFDEYNKPCIENGYLIIGEGPNGDLLCVDIKKGLSVVVASVGLLLTATHGLLIVGASVVEEQGL